MFILSYSLIILIMVRLHQICTLLFLYTNFLDFNTASKDFIRASANVHPNLHYEQFGEVLLSMGNWQLVTSVDYHGYLLFYEYLLTQAEKLQKFCIETKPELCHNMCGVIRDKLDRVNNGHESIHTLFRITTKSRVKRFWNAIGTHLPKAGRGSVEIKKPIFDNNFGPTNLSDYDKELNNLQNGQGEVRSQPDRFITFFSFDLKQTKRKWLKQIKGVTVSESVPLTGSREKEKKIGASTIQAELKELEDNRRLLLRVDKIEKYILDFDEYIGVNDLQTLHNCDAKVLIFFKQLLLILDQFDYEQSDLIRAIGDVKKGRLNSYILTPSSLLLMLKDIQFNLTEGLSFPFYTTVDNAYKLYGIVKPSVYLYNNKLIFILHLPLVKSKTYRIHKISNQSISLDPNKVHLIQSQAPLLIADKTYREYTLKSLREFRNLCEEIDESKYLCREIQEVSEYEQPQEKKKSNLTALHYTSICVAVVLILCVSAYLTYRKTRVKKINNKSPLNTFKPRSPTKFQVRFTMKRNNSGIRRLVFNEPPKVTLKMRKEQIPELLSGQMQSSSDEVIDKHYDKIGEISDFKEYNFLSELKNLNSTRNHQE